MTIIRTKHIAAVALAALVGVSRVNGGIVFTNLVSLDGTNGAGPIAFLQGADGLLYGVQIGQLDFGSVFRMEATGALNKLLVFGGTNGNFPRNLIQATNGDLYGTTEFGGDYTLGNVIRVTTNGVLKMSVSFDGTNGANPFGRVIVDDEGNIYGTTLEGGVYDYGTVFKISTNGLLTTIVNFDGTNGIGPAGGLVSGLDGFFYGATVSGGIDFSPDDETISPGHQNIFGTIFRVKPDGTFSSLCSFSGTNGWKPWNWLTLGPNGCFYGVTYNGGPTFDSTNWGSGTIFRVTTNGTLTCLYRFMSGSDGARPWAGLTLGSDGNFYGTTTYGGDQPFLNESGGDGTVFKITPDGQFSVVFTFNGTNGSNVAAGMVQRSDGDLYGGAWFGGDYGQGTIFRLSVPMPPEFRTISQSNEALTLSWSAVARQTYQLQFCTNLGSTNWNNLGTTTTATNGVMCATDLMGQDTQRFYRVVLLP